MFRKQLVKVATVYNEALSNSHNRVFGEEFFPAMSRPEFDGLYRAFMEVRLQGDELAEGVRRIGAKDPEHGTIISDLAGHFPDAAYIQMIRDPRDVAVSTWSHMKRLDPAFAGPAGGFAEFARQNVREWTIYVSHVRKAAARPFQYLEVRYEDLHGDGAATLARTLDFLGVDVGVDVVSRCLDEASFERATGGRERGQADETSFYRKGAIGDWRGHMAPALGDELLAMTRGLAGELGYR